MAKKKKVKAKEASPPFEQSLAELEDIVAQLEGGELGLDDALEQYEQGVTRLKQCHQQLERAEQRIELLSGVDAEGNPISQPMSDENGGSLEEKAASRAQRRSRKAAPGQSSGVDDASRLF